jgi:hypothetical protein
MHHLVCSKPIHVPPAYVVSKPTTRIPFHCPADPDPDSIHEEELKASDVIDLGHAERF